MAASPWTAEILDRFAAHVSWEVRSCTSQLELLVREYGNAIPAPPAGFSDPMTPPDEWTKRDALLHSSLMHLRSLDDFLSKGSQRQGPTPDIRAQDWFEGTKYQWPREYWLDPRERALIDWNVVHLSSLRNVLDPVKPPWRPADYGRALCGEMTKFFDAVEKNCPDRLPAFDQNVQGDIARRAKVFKQHSTR